MLTRRRGSHGCVLATGACRLGRKEVRQLAPRRVLEALSQTLGLPHALDRHVCNGTERNRVRETAAVVLSKVPPSPPAARVDAGHHRAPRRAFGRASRGWTQTTRCRGACLLRLAEEARLGQRLTSAARGNGRASSVQAHLWPGRWQRGGRTACTRAADVPRASPTASASGRLGGAVQRALHDDLRRSYVHRSAVHHPPPLRLPVPWAADAPLRGE